MDSKSPSMGGVLEYIKRRKDGAAPGSDAAPSSGPSFPPKEASPPGSEGTGLPYGKDGNDECVVCENCGHENRKKEAARLDTAQGNFDTQEP